MAFYHRVINLLKPPHFQDEEKNRIAGVTQVIAIATLCGMCIIFVDRIILGAYHLIFLISLITFIIIEYAERVNLSAMEKPDPTK